MVPISTPRDRCERNFTHSKNSPGWVLVHAVFSCWFISSQVVLKVSTARWSARHAQHGRFRGRRETVNAGQITGVADHKNPACGQTDLVMAGQVGVFSSDRLSMVCQTSPGVEPACGSSELCRLASSIRAVFSARPPCNGPSRTGGQQCCSTWCVFPWGRRPVSRVEQNRPGGRRGWPRAALGFVPPRLIQSGGVINSV